MIKIRINLSNIPKDKIINGENGKYLGVVVTELRQPDNYGNTHTAYIEQTKEERERKENRVYIGKGKLVEFQNKTAKADEVPDLPF